MNWKQAFTLGLLAPGVWGGRVVSDGWEVVYDEMVTTKNPDSVSANTNIYNTDVLIGDALYRLTVDDRFTFEARNVQKDGSVKCFGNIYLWLPNQNQDNGEDFFLLYASVNHDLWYPGGLYSREAGTYHIKVERKKPVAYLYGEDKVRLPELPEWDKTVLPYATISKIAVGGGHYNYQLLLTDAKIVFLPGYEGSYGQINTEDEKCNYKDAVVYGTDLDTATEWGNLSSGIYYGTPYLTPPHIVWANYDVTNADETKVVLAKSNPTPVYE